jgi:rubrerythrin
MKIIKELTELVEEELEDAEKYIKLAFAHKDDNASLARTFYELSTQEMNHVAMLHEEVVKIIEEHRKIKGDPPAAMMAVYDYLHKNPIVKEFKIKGLKAKYEK